MERSIVVNKASLAVLAFGALTLAACESKKASTDSSAAAAASAAPPAAAPATTPAPAAMGVSIVSPKEGDSTGTDVTIVLAKEGTVTIEKASGKKAEGVGHYHLFLDTVATADGQVIPP